MTTLVNSFEGGTNGVTITNANAGGSTGYGGGPQWVNNQFDSIGITGTGSAAFDSTRSAHGLLSLKVSSSASGDTGSTQWIPSLGTQTQIWFRAYLYFTGIGSVNARVVSYETSGLSLCAFVVVNNAGKLVMQDSTNAVLFTFATSVPLNQWFRVEGFVSNSATAGYGWLSRYDQMDAFSPTETHTSTATFNTLASGGAALFGIAGSVGAVGPYWVDDVGVSTTGPLGPVVFPAYVPDLLPAPPGFLSPAAFPFPNGPFPLPNDAPPTTPQPYIIGVGQSYVTSTTVTINVQQATSPGDAIVVIVSSPVTPLTNNQTSDTRGNSYCAVVRQGTAGIRNAIYVAANTKQLGITDTITATFNSTTNAKNAIALGFPAGIMPVPSDYLDYDPAIINYNPATGNTELTTPAGGSVAGMATAQSSGGPFLTTAPRALIAVAVTPFAVGPPAFSQGWTVIGNVVDNTATAPSIAVAWQLMTRPVLANNQQIVTTVQGPSATSGLALIGLMGETRFASQPGVISGPPNPPGFLSPASAPDTPPMPPGTINDAPVPNAPYVVGSVAANAPLTIQVQTPTNPGDTIVVLVGAASGLGLATACTDTKGNTYSLYLFPGNAEAYQLVAVNPVPLTTSDTITVTFGVSSLARMAIAVAIPRSAVSAGPSGYAVPDNITTTASNSTRLLWPASYANVGTTPEVVLVAVAAQTSNTGVINWAPQVIPFGPVLSTGGYSLSAAWVPVASLQKPLVGPVFIFPAAGNLGAMAVSYTAETRVAPANPQLTGSLPPGMLSPAAMPFAPPTALPQAVNDAPPTTPQPYLIAQGQKTASAQSITLPVQNASNLGDVILVFGVSSSQSQPGGVTDTKGNYYQLTAWQTSGNRSGLFAAVNPVPLTMSDSITYTWSSNVPATKDLMVIGVPAAMYAQMFPSTPGAGDPLTFDNFYGPQGSRLTVNATAQPSGVANPAAGVASSGRPALCIVVFANSGTSGSPSFGQDWIPFASFADNAGSFVMVWAYKFVSTNAQGTTLAWSQGNIGTIDMSVVSLYPETRFAAQPGIASNSQASPPGLMSPGAWPVLPQAPTTINDVPPPANAPYFVGAAATNSSPLTLTIPVTQATNPHDAIVVNTTEGSGGATLVSCTDTQGNSYSIFGSVLGFGDSWQAIAQNTVPLSPANGDSITVTYTSTHPVSAIAVGVPASAAGGSAEQWLTYDLINKTGSATIPSLNASAVPATGAPGVPEVIIAFSTGATAVNGPAAFPQDFTVIGNAAWTVSTAYTAAVAYKIAASGIAASSVVVWTQQNAGANAGLLYVTLRLETQVAPNRPAPDMPPGMLSPGAWQFSAAREYGLGSGIKYPSASGPIPVTPPLVDGFIMKRPPVRGVWRGEEVPFIIAVPLVGGQIVQHPHERGYWRGEEAPFLPLGKAAVGGLIIPHRHIRGFWEGKDVPFQYGKPNTGGFVAPHPHERGTWRGEDAPFIYGKPVTGGFNSVHSHERSEWRYILGQVPPPPPPAGTVPPHIFTAKRPWVRVWWKGTAPFAPAKSLGPGMSIVTGPVYLEWTTGPVEGEWGTGPVSTG